MMKAKIVSTVPRSRFELFKVEIPDQWEVDFVDYPLAGGGFDRSFARRDFLLVGSVHHQQRRYSCRPR